MADPSSAKLEAPVHPRKPDAAQTTRLAPTLCVLATTIPGEELKRIYKHRCFCLDDKVISYKIPDPIYQTQKREKIFNYSHASFKQYQALPAARRIVRSLIK